MQKPKSAWEMLTNVQTTTISIMCLADLQTNEKHINPYMSYEDFFWS
jgi:hypothetical protein